MMKYNIQVSDEDLKPVIDNIKDEIRAEVSIDIARNYLNTVDFDMLCDVFYNTIAVRYNKLKGKKVSEMDDHETLTVILYNILSKYID